MVYPAGLVTQAVSAGSTLTLETGEDLYTRITATASRDDLVWYATGQRITSYPTSNTSAQGGEATVTLPVTNQDNVWSANGDLIHIGDGTNETDVFTYTFKVDILRAGSNNALEVLDSWTLPGVPLHASDGVLDLDKIVYIPGGAEGGVSVPIPDTWTDTLNAAQAAAAAAQQSAQDTADASAATAQAAADQAAAASNTAAQASADSAAAAAQSAQDAADTVAGWTATADDSVHTILENTGSETRQYLDTVYVPQHNPTLGTTDTDVTQDRTVTMETHTRSQTLGYTAGVLTSVTEKSGATTVKTTTINYSGSQIATVVETAGGVTKTTTFNYDGSGNLTGTTRS